MKISTRLLAIMLTFSSIGLLGNIPTQAKKTSPTEAAKVSEKTSQPAKVADNKPEEVLSVSPLELLKNSQQYLYKKVAFEGTFNSFSSLGLDYKRAFRDPKDYVSMLILRPDVTPAHKIPLAELKLFYPRKKSEDVLHLDAGDKVSIQGQVFSSALGESWVDIQELKILNKVKK